MGDTRKEGDEQDGDGEVNARDGMVAQAMAKHEARLSFWRLQGSMPK